MNKLDELIKSIPFELEGCFYIKINYNLANEISNQYTKDTGKCLIFPFTYKGIEVIRNKFASNELSVIPNKETYLKVSSYEVNKAEKFLNEYEKLCRKHNLSISGCGCCGSPYLEDDFYTISIENILYDEDKLSYDINLTYEARKYLQIDRGE